MLLPSQRMCANQTDVMPDWGEVVGEARVRAAFKFDWFFKSRTPVELFGR